MLRNRGQPAETARLGLGVTLPVPGGLVELEFDDRETSCAASDEKLMATIVGQTPYRSCRPQTGDLYEGHSISTKQWIGPRQ